MSEPRFPLNVEMAFEDSDQVEAIFAAGPPRWLQLDRCLERCDCDYDWEGLGIEQDMNDLCNEVCHEQFGDGDDQ